MISVHLNGGLGNQLFQLATIHHLGKKHNKVACVDTLIGPPNHSSRNYFDGIFSKWKDTFASKNFQAIFEQKDLEYYRYDLPENPKLFGYFQNWKHVDDDFKDTLQFNRDILSKYPNIADSVFLHVRGGDYLHEDCLSKFYIDLSNYYKNAVKHFPEGTHFSVFTNDLPFAERYLKDFSYSVIQENDEESLFLMTQCSGGICANSNFSWMGAFLNNHRKLILPSQWYKGTDCSEIYFHGCTIVDV
jgi:hypothetical protein